MVVTTTDGANEPIKVDIARASSRASTHAATRPAVNIRCAASTMGSWDEAERRGEFCQFLLDSFAGKKEVLTLKGERQRVAQR